MSTSDKPVAPTAKRWRTKSHVSANRLASAINIPPLFVALQLARDHIGWAIAVLALFGVVGALVSTRGPAFMRKVDPTVRKRVFLAGCAAIPVYFLALFVYVAIAFGFGWLSVVLAAAALVVVVMSTFEIKAYDELPDWHEPT